LESATDGFSDTSFVDGSDLVAKEFVSS
jgi:hypothetical protein